MVGERSECDLSLCYFKDPGGASDKESACKHVKGERERERFSFNSWLNIYKAFRIMLTK